MSNHLRLQPPHIGLRIIKSSVAVFICFCVCILYGETNPFYAAIAAILCMQNDVTGSKKTGINRIVGTFIGGFAGMLVLALERAISNSSTLGYAASAVISAVMIIPLIYTAVLVKKPTAAFITCVVFLSITVMHAADVNPFLFGLMRILDTFVGIGAALLLNAIHLPRCKNQGILFVVDRKALVESDNKISGFTKVRLNRLLEDGARIAVFTTRPAADAAPQLDSIRFDLPLIAQNGAVLYDLKSSHYMTAKILPAPVAAYVERAFQKVGMHGFCFTIINDYQHIYYEAFDNPAEEDYYRREMRIPYKCFVCADRPAERDPISYMAINSFDRVHTLRQMLVDGEFGDELAVRAFPCPGHPEYYQIEIHTARTSKLELLKELQQQTYTDEMALFTTQSVDLPMLEYADYTFRSENGKFSFNDVRDGNQTVRQIEKMYHSRKLFRGRQKKEK